MAFCLGVSDAITVEEKTVLDSIKGVLQNEAETEKTKNNVAMGGGGQNFLPG